jgi:alanyl-tRNA synthetase
MNSTQLNPSYIIADHIRAACFIIADGVMPSGKQRGYILRRLIRRSLSASLKMKIDISQNQYFVELVDSVIGIYDGVYDEIKENRETIIQILTQEAQKYLKAINTGQKEWGKILKINS